MTISHPPTNELIRDHQSLVHSLAIKIHRQLPPHIQLDDIISYGQLGLTQAARAFQHTGQSTFATYAYYRIRGAMFDGLTKMNWASRAAYQRMKAEQMASEALRSGEQRGAASSAESEAKWFAETAERLAMVYLTTYAGDEQSELHLEDEKTESPDRIAENTELCSALRIAVAKLPEPAKSLIDLSYFQGLSLAEAAEKLGKSRSWASRMHGKVLSQLAYSMGADPGG